MADNEIKILKSNTFEDWRQKSNEVSLNLGADDRLDSRLTDKVFKHDNVSGLKLSIIDGNDDDSKAQVFQLIPETTIDNTGGYIILAHGTSIPAAFIKGAGVSQSGGYGATIESIVTIDNKPKILVKNSSGDFNAGENLTVGSSSIPSSNIKSLIAESYNKASVRVLNGSTELVQGLLEANFHVPTVSGKVTLAGSPNLTKFVEGSTIYQASANQTSQANVETNATWYATVYHSGSSDVYVKSHSGTYSSSSQIRILGYTASEANITSAQHNSFSALDQTVGHVIEFNNELTANDDIKVIATDLVTAINEVQDDIGQVESLNTRYATKEVVNALNQIDTHLYDSGVSFTGLSANDFKAGINELRAELGDHTTINNNTGYGATTAAGGIVEIQNDIGDIDNIQTSHTSTLVGGINEIEEALRGTSLTNYTLTTDSANGVVGGINEIENALRGNLSNYTVSAGNNIVAGLNAVYDDIHTSGSVTISTDASHLVGGINELENVMRTASSAVSNYSLNTDAHNIVAAINELEDALRGTTGNYVTWGSGANISAGDVRGAIVELGTTIGSGVITGADTEAVGASNLTVAVNLLNTAIGDSDIYNTGTYGSATIAGTLDNLKTGVVNNDTDIGNLQKQIDGATSPIDTSRSWTGLAATNISSAIQEIADTTLTAGNGLTSGSGGNLRANRSFAVGATSGGGITVATNGIGVDSTVVRTNTANQTVDTNLTFTTGNTLTIPTGAVLDIDGALQIGGSGGGSLTYATSFITIAGDNPQTGLEIDRSEIDTATVSTTLDAKIQWNEGVVGTKPDRAWQAVGIDDSGNALTADIVTFYNAQDLISNNTETDLNATWDSTNQNFDFALKTTGVSANQYGGTTAIPVLTIDAKGRITAASTANIVTELTFSAETNSGGSGHQVINLATETLHFDGVANQIVTEAKDDEVEFGLPSDLRAPGTLRVLSTTQSTSTSTGSLRVDGGVGIAKNLHVGGNLTVSGTQTIVNSNQVNIGDAIITLNSDETGTPSENAGIEVERGTSTNKTLLWNEANAQWEVDGVAIVTEATDFDNWRLAASGVSSSESITSGETVTFALTPVDGLNGLTVTRSGSTINYGHANTSTLSGNQGTASGGNVIQTVTVDTYGHVTGVGTADLDNRFMRSWTFMEGNGSETGTISQGQTLHFEQGTGIEVEKTADRQLTITNNDRGSSQNIFKNIIVEQPDGTDIQSWAADNNNDTFFIREVQVDSTSGIELTSISTGANDRMGIAHANTSSQASSNNSNNVVIQDITLDTYGHITGLETKDITTVTNANNINVDEKNDNVNYQVLFNANNGAGYQRPYIDTDNAHFLYNPSTTLLSGINVDWNDIINEPTFDNYVSWTAYDNDNSQCTITSGDILKFAEGSGMDVDFTADDVLTFTNTDRGSSQNIFKNVKAYASNALTQRGTTQSADSNNDTLQFIEQGGITLNTPADDTIGIAHADTSTLSGQYTTANHSINSITVDGYGHVTAVSTHATDNYGSWTFMEGNGSETGTVGSGQTLHFEQGTGITIEKTADRQLTITNATPNVVTNISCAASGNTVNVNSSDGTDGTIPLATTTAAGVMSKEDKSKLNGIDTGADVNQNAFATLGFGEYDSSTQTSVNQGVASAGSASANANINFMKGFDVSVSGTNATISLQNDRRSRYSNEDVYHGNTHDYMFSDASVGLRFYTAGAEDMRLTDSGTLHVDGDVIAFSTTISDERLKENIQVVDNALEKVSQLKGVTFDWKKDGQKSAGLIAQDVEKVLPSAVKETELPLNSDENVEYKTVEYSQITSLLVESIKELREENKQLRAEIEALKDINR